ncbi:hypothetical protein SUGI_0707940 [Cryptomeria japonica]|uniref:casparian strip membrane protein 1-like n=1 Tax=Cryptomeria japonica TaxID=3369 RepID=UPI0024149A0E|nr:casparian strip membrane protein 1-like [Cryptomeria japonica]GLJ35170.1 hypothetical protein SUGI_0707940 [Cryptomeria japonica]
MNERVMVFCKVVQISKREIKVYRLVGVLQGKYLSPLMNMKGDKNESAVSGKEATMDFSSGYRAGGLREIFLRLMATLTTLGAAIFMGLDKQTIDVYGVYLYAKYYYMPAFTFFVVANATAALYGLLSLAIYYCSNVKGRLHCIRKWLFFFDFMMTLVITSGVSAAAAIGYIGLEGNNHVGWIEVCKEFEMFCQRGGGALCASAMGLLIFIGLTVVSAGSQQNLSKISEEDSTAINKA